MKNFETELPQNYKQVKIIDAKNAKISVVLNLIALAVVLACVLGAYFIIGVPYDELIAGETNIVHNVIRIVVFFVIAVSYIILHELVPKRNAASILSNAEGKTKHKVINTGKNTTNGASTAINAALR